MTLIGKPNSLGNQAGQGENPLKGLLRFGQSVWLDYIRHDLISKDGVKLFADAFEQLLVDVDRRAKHVASMALR